jgi:tripartite-type tricarboxylate transporter receptor subunit TctC
MKFPRRQFLHLAAGAAALPAASSIARAQTYPTRPIRLVAPFPAGGVVDLYARLIGQVLTERLGQTVLIDNRGGAGGNIGTEAVVHAPPDGYTLLLVSTVNAWNATIYSKLNFNFIRDITPVASFDRGAGILVTNPSFIAKSVPELIAYAKANPGKISMASAGIGSSNHVYGELFKMMAGVDMLHVPYRGGGFALTDIIGGQVDLTFDLISTTVEHIRTGKLRALAVTSATRSPLWPEIPSVGEFVPGYEATGWQGIGVPKNTPIEIVEKLNKEINASLADPKVNARIVSLGNAAFAGSPADFAKLIADETEKWAKVVKFAGIKVD